MAMMPAFARLPRRRLNHIVLLRLPEGHARQDGPITYRPAQKTQTASVACGQADPMRELRKLSPE